jgi:hypothetical protein
MDLNSISLSGTVLAELYGNTLVEQGVYTPNAEEPKPVKEEAKSTGWKSLGDNKKNILVLVNYSGVEYLPEQQLNFLNGMLGACKLELSDIALINIGDHHSASYKEIMLQFKSRIILLFDIAPTSIGLPLDFPHFQIQPFSGNSFLYSPSLDELENDKMLKSKIWVCLRRLFNI